MKKIMIILFTFISFLTLTMNLKADGCYGLEKKVNNMSDEDLAAGNTTSYYYEYQWLTGSAEESAKENNKYRAFPLITDKSKCNKSGYSEIYGSKINEKFESWKTDGSEHCWKTADGYYYWGVYTETIKSAKNYGKKISSASSLEKSFCKGKADSDGDLKYENEKNNTFAETGEFKADASLFFPDTQISTEDSSCMQLLGGSGSSMIEFIQNAWTVIKVLSIVLSVVFGVFDFVKASASSKDKLSESLNTSIKRIIIVIIVLLLPTIIDIVGNILGQENILCGIR